MKHLLQTLSAGGLVIFCSCNLMVNAPVGDDDEEGGTIHKPPVEEKFEFAASGTFPFTDNANWWRYSETDGNRLNIDVTDTISDDNVLYYRVSFREHRVDTTDDWFKKDNGDILFGPSLIGSYELFLPSKLVSRKGTYSCGFTSVDYSYHDTMTINGFQFKKVLSLRYSSPILHGFDEIIMADSLGMIQMKDVDGRWPVCYNIDSCRVFGKVTRF